MLLNFTLDNESVSSIEGYDGLPVEGSTVSFSCPPEFMLSGPDSATCTENGEWEPDPRGIMCHHLTSEFICNDPK